ncbi:hypothetical protein [Aliidiomarina sp.]|uniref:hypothetical protein n=1 Tax=Aliidiomarina sp. TaxID=1872439 RepID=UPI003A4E37ED
MASNLFLLIIVVIVIVFLARRVFMKPGSGATVDAEPVTKSSAQIEAEVAEKEQTIAEKAASVAENIESSAKEGKSSAQNTTKNTTKNATKSASKPATKKVAKKAAPKSVSKDVDPVIDSGDKSQPSPIGAELPDEIASPVAELEKSKDPLARHRLYQQITESSYKNRTDAAWRQISKTFSNQHISEFADILKPLKKANGGSLPQVLTFQNYATLLAEDKQYDEAIAVCEKALEFGLDDKTKTGFAGRIERIRKQKAKG